MHIGLQARKAKHIQSIELKGAKPTPSLVKGGILFALAFM
jgi:hypothetical protein